MAPKKRARAATDAKKPAAKKQKADVEDASAARNAESPTTVNDLFKVPVKKQQNDAQKARTANLAIPVDEGCPLDGEFYLLQSPLLKEKDGSG
jgi:hypothetical protein